MTPRELIVSSILKCSRADLYLNPPQISSKQEDIIDGMLKRVQEGEPLQYVIGYTEFMGYKINVDPRVLIPRPETEILVDSTVKHIQKSVMLAQASISNEGDSHLRGNDKLKILNIGTGSGCIEIALAKLLPQSKITGIDVSKDAIECAQLNVKNHQLEGQITLFNENMISYLSKPNRVFDVIISNPPYIPHGALKTLPQDVQQEPQQALDGGMDGLSFYRAMASYLAQCLNEGGLIALEHGDGQEQAISKILKDRKIKVLKTIKDYTDTSRIILATKY